MKDWEEKKLGEVCKFIGGSQPSKNFFSFDQKENFIRLIQIRDYKSDKNIVYIPKDKAKRFCDENDIMIGRYGPPVFQILKGLKGAYNVALMKAVPNEKHLSKEYAFAFLKYSKIQDYIIHLSQRAAGQTGVNKEAIEDYPILLPPLQEQQRIVAILDEAFRAIDKAKANTEQNLKNAKELFEYHLHMYFTNKENGWEEKKLKEVAEYFNGLTYSPKNVSDEGIIVLRSSNIQNDKLDFKDIVRVNLTVKDKIKVIDGDILMCSRNGSQRLVGKTAKIENLNEIMTFGTFMMIIRSEYNPYLSWFFKSMDFKKQISGGENTMINQITRYMLDEVVLSFPPIKDQQTIVSKLDALREQTKKLEAVYEQKLQDLEELKKSILSKAFSGEL
jgi:type I restriction enzyme S subunit